ncbi:aliphatic sulfonate ABC transporter substrate-binding protein [Acetobacter sp.]|uniref:aliphatic sulfonate ABC transporter substrate-binding protein n=1 Tax=Acetobacter sp. TaxID=440 RepID=UPI0039E82C62
MKNFLSRRTLLGASFLSLLPFPLEAAPSLSGPVDGNSGSTLFIGDQKGGVRSLLRAAGQLERLPYRIQWASFPVGAPLISAIASGSLDFGYVGDATATFTFAAGSSLKAISAWHVDGKSNALLVPGSSNVRTLRDLIGRRVAFVKGSPGHLLVLTALQREGLGADQIVQVPLAAANARMALSSGSIDAWAIWDPYAATAEIEDHARILLTAHGLVDEVECGIASEAAITHKRAELTDFMSRVGKALAWSVTHLEQRALAFSRDTGTSLDIARVTSSRMVMTALPSVTDEVIAIHQKVADLYHAAGVIPSQLNVANFYDRSFLIPV